MFQLFRILIERGPLFALIVTGGCERCPPPTNDGLLVKPSVSCRIITLSANFSGVPNLTFCVVTTHLVAFGRCRVSQSRSLKLPFGYYFGGSAESTSETNNAPITVMAASNKKILKFSVNKYSSYSSNYFPE